MSLRKNIPGLPARIAAWVYAVLLTIVFKATIALFVLFIMLLVLLVPYIKHYFVLENGVQTLYVIYEEVCRRYMDKSVPIACIPEEYGIRIEKLK